MKLRVMLETLEWNFQLAVARAWTRLRAERGLGGVTDCEPFTRVPESNVLDDTESC